MRAVTRDNLTVYAGYSRGPFSGWTVTFSVPADIVDAKLRRSLVVIIGGGALLTLLGNALWAAWLRRRVPDAWRRSRVVLARTPRRRQRVGAILAALGGVPWVLSHRRVVPAYIEEALRSLDGPAQAERRRRRRGVVDSGIASGLASGSSNRLAR